MTMRSEAEINRLLASTAAEYADEERAAAEEESQAATASTVFSVRLQPAVYEAVKTAAGRAHMTGNEVLTDTRVQRPLAVDAHVLGRTADHRPTRCLDDQRSVRRASPWTQAVEQPCRADLHRERLTCDEDLVTGHLRDQLVAALLIELVNLEGTGLDRVEQPV
jgi:hypothetical protein